MCCSIYAIENLGGSLKLVVALGLNGSRTVILIGNGNGTFQTPIVVTEPAMDVLATTATLAATAPRNAPGLPTRPSPPTGP